MKPLRIGLLNYECVIMQSKLPVLLIFGAVWDNKSLRLFEQLDYISKKYDGKFITGKVDYDYAPDIFSDNKIKDVSTMIFFEDGKPTIIQENTDTYNDVESFVRRFYGILPY